MRLLSLKIRILNGLNSNIVGELVGKRNNTKNI